MITPPTMIRTPIGSQQRTLSAAESSSWSSGNWDDESFYVEKYHHHEWRVDITGFWGRRKEIIEWCKETFGPHGNNRKYTWRINFSSNYPSTIFFRNESDVTLFSLKWA